MYVFKHFMFWMPDIILLMLIKVHGILLRVPLPDGSALIELKARKN